MKISDLIQVQSKEEIGERLRFLDRYVSEEHCISVAGEPEEAGHISETWMLFTIPELGWI
jgi:hypothetical protein